MANVLRMTKNVKILYGGTKEIALSGVYEVSKGTYQLLATLVDGEGNPLSGKTVNFYFSTDSSTWTLLGSNYTNAEGEASYTVEVTRSGFYKAEFPGDEAYDGSSDIIRVTVKEEAVPSEAMPSWIIFVALILLLLLGVSYRRREEERTATF